MFGTNMWTFLIVAVCTLYQGGQATRLHQEFPDLNLHANFGAALSTDPESTPITPLEEYVSYEGMRYLFSLIKKLKPHPFLMKQYRPFKLDIPGRKSAISIYMNNTEVSGLNHADIFDLKWHLGKNRIDFNTSIPFLIIDVDASILIDLDPNLFNETLSTSVRITVRLVDLDVSMALRYNTGVQPKEQAIFIDGADVHIHTKEALVYINIVYGLEEIRYELADIFNYPLEDIAGAVLKEAVQGINEYVLAKVKPKAIIRYLTIRLDESLEKYAHLITINHV